jgi:hypothetical protein
LPTHWVRELDLISSYVFSSTKNPMVCVVSGDPTRESLPPTLGPWVRTEAPRGGQDADFPAGIREVLETGEDKTWDGEPPPLRN